MTFQAGKAEPTLALSWLNIAENELSSLTRQCVSVRRFADVQELREEASAWLAHVNSIERGVDWQIKWTTHAVS